MQADDVVVAEEITDYRNAAVAKSYETIKVCQQLISELFEPHALRNSKHSALHQLHKCRGTVHITSCCKL